MVIAGLDLLPEEVEWRDEGCEVFPACLSCPLPRCIEEEPRGRQRLKAVLRARQMNALRRNGKSIKEIAGLFGVSNRTVQRALEKQKPKRKRQNDRAKVKTSIMSSRGALAPWRSQHK